MCGICDSSPWRDFVAYQARSQTLPLDEPGCTATHTISAPWLGKGRGKHPAPTLGFVVITVLCTQNNWSHQCGCRVEILALPHHRCSPFSGQNPPIKSKQVAKRPRTPPMLLLPGERPVFQHFHSSQSVSQGGRKTDGLARSRERGFLRSAHRSHVWKRT